jgi:very-short-patch-repair endonuclease
MDNLKPLARNLRKSQTDAEKHLWQRLRDRQLGGHKFRRQHSIGPYIADFVCIERNLIIELDGGQHADQQTHDAQRSEFLRSEGFAVIRFWNHEVLANIEAVLQVIYQRLQNPSPSPSPLEKGRG